MKELDIIRKAFGSAKLPDRDSVYPPGVSAKAPKRGGNGRLAIELAAGGALLFVMVLAVAIGPGLIRKDYVAPAATVAGAADLKAGELYKSLFVIDGKEYGRLISSSDSAEDAVDVCKRHFTDNRYEGSINTPVECRVIYESDILYGVYVKWIVSGSTYEENVISLKKEIADVTVNNVVYDDKESYAIKTEKEDQLEKIALYVFYNKYHFYVVSDYSITDEGWQYRVTAHASRGSGGDLPMLGKMGAMSTVDDYEISFVINKSNGKVSFDEPEILRTHTGWAITYHLGSAADVFTVMPYIASAGETVELRTEVLYDADIHVYVNGQEISKSHYDSDYWGYSFVMPDENVKISARFYTKEEILGTGNDELTVLKEKYPEYFGLSTSKGLDVYVWQMAPGSYSFGLLSGTNRNKADEELMNLKGASAEEMKIILSMYGYSKESIGIIPWQNPASSYISEFWAVSQDEDPDSVARRRGDYINGIREMLYGEAPIAFESKVAYANYTDDPKIHSCLNADKLTLDSEPHVPVFRFDTKGDLDKFRETFGDVLTFTYGYSEVPSFNEATAGYDDDFFADHTVILAYVGTVSGSFRFGVGGVSVSGSELCLHIENLLKNLQQWTCDMAGWFVMAEFADENIAGITDFDAIIEDGKVAKDWWLPQKSDTGAADGK